MLQIIIDIKHYILNLVPSKLTLLESIDASIVVDHQMAVIHVQVGKNFIEDVLLDCRNPSLGLATKARACKGAGQE